jgi:hypothetical protein
MRTYDDALKIAAKIKAGEVHLGKEMTVVSVSCFGESGTYPILALPTCKFVGVAESSMIYETVTATWLEHAAAKVGMPWSWSTDGESSRRSAGYDQFVRHKLGPTSPIFGTLASMAGLNIFTGIHSITLDFDYKHIFKRTSFSKFCVYQLTWCGRDMYLNSFRSRYGSLQQPYYKPSSSMPFPRTASCPNR